MTPVVLGRVEVLSAGALALQTRYVSDAVPVLVICLGLAFLPLAGQPDIRRRLAVPTGTQAGRLAAAGLVGAFIIGSVWSVQDLQSTTSGVQARLYIDNAQAAVAEAPAGTVIADSPVPTAIMIGAFGQDAGTSRVIGPMEDAAAAARIRWTSRPDGTIDHLMVFGADGRLRLAAIYGQTSSPPATGRQCHPASRGRVVATFPVPADPHSQVLRIAYLADSGGRRREHDHPLRDTPCTSSRSSRACTPGTCRSRAARRASPSPARRPAAYASATCRPASSCPRRPAW